MQDATNLAWKLVHVLRHGADARLLDSYEEERLPAAKAVLASTDRNTKLLFAQGALAKWFRDAVFVPALSTRLVQRRLVSRLSQLHVGYRSTSLAATRRWAPRAGLDAGDRAPDIVLASGATLFSLLGRGQFVALFGTAGTALAARCARLGIATGMLSELAARGYGGRRNVWLVRPDGYIAIRCALSNARALSAGLRRFYDVKLVDATFAIAGPPRLDTRRGNSARS